MHRFSMLLPIVGLALLIAPRDADATKYRYLCTSHQYLCEYTGPDAPALDAVVCVDGAGGVYLQGSPMCSPGTPFYSVTHGEVVDPMTAAVQAYAPLGDACDVPGLCVQGPSGGGVESTICCDPETDTCYPGGTCGGDLYWCYDGITNADNTVTCFEAEPL